ncbi:MAG: plasmid recombination protein [Deltaproteobacteria bacterium]|nr:plasmid recombination protein [Deltaproteobacteria bacterium]
MFRLKKLKTFEQINGELSHNLRTAKVANAFADRLELNRHLLGQTGVDLNAWIREKLNGVKIRVNSILAVAGLIEVSPEYMRPGEPEKPGVYREDRLEPWLKCSTSWLEKNYGSNIINATAHLDEVTPNIHFLFVPIGSHGRLDGSQYAGTIEGLQGQMDSYAEAVRPLGLSHHKNNFYNYSGQRNLIYYSFVKRSLYPRPVMVPLAIPKLSLPWKMSRRFNSKAGDFILKSAKLAVEKLGENNIKKWDSLKAVLTDRLAAWKAEIEKNLALNEEIECVRSLQFLILDRSLKHWLPYRPWAEREADSKKIKPENPMSDGTEAEFTGIQPASSKRTGKRNKWVLKKTTAFMGIFNFKFMGPVRISGDRWEFLRSKLQGRGGLAFFTYFLGYNPGQESQVLKLLAADKAFSYRCGHNKIDWETQILARLLINSVNERLAKALRAADNSDISRVSFIEKQVTDNHELVRFLDVKMSKPQKTEVSGLMKQESPEPAEAPSRFSP